MFPYQVEYITIALSFVPFILYIYGRMFDTMVRVAVHRSRRIGLISAYTLVTSFLKIIVLMMDVLLEWLTVLLEYFDFSSFYR